MSLINDPTTSTTAAAAAAAAAASSSMAGRPLALVSHRSSSTAAVAASSSTSSVAAAAAAATAAAAVAPSGLLRHPLAVSLLLVGTHGLCDGSPARERETRPEHFQREEKLCYWATPSPSNVELSSLPFLLLLPPLTDAKIFNLRN